MVLEGVVTVAAAPTPRSHDEDPRRATFGVPYPLGDDADLVFANKDDFPNKVPPIPKDSTKSPIRGKRIAIRVPLRTFEDVLFEECNFHDRRGNGFAEIPQITFRRCGFRRTFFGNTHFFRVRFLDCTFERCDFSHDEFEECLFENCRFIECSSWSAVFRQTEIEPRAFLDGMALPDDNLEIKTARLRSTIRREWLHARLRIAEQLFRSNTERMNSGYSDSSLLAVKHAANAWEWDVWRYGSASDYSASPLGLLTALRRDWPGPVAALARATLLSLTAGGTSIRNLASVLILVTLLFPAALASLNVSYAGVRCSVSASSFGTDYLRLLLASVSLVLGFGFTNFSAADTGGLAALVFGSGLGVFWYALLLSVLIRRVYR